MLADGTLCRVVTTRDLPLLQLLVWIAVVVSAGAQGGVLFGHPVGCRTRLATITFLADVVWDLLCCVGRAIHPSLQRRVACLFSTRAEYRVLHESWISRCISILPERARRTSTNEFVVRAVWTCSVVTTCTLLLCLNWYEIAFLVSTWSTVKHVE